HGCSSPHWRRLSAQNPGGPRLRVAGRLFARWRGGPVPDPGPAPGSGRGLRRDGRGACALPSRSPPGRRDGVTRAAWRARALRLERACRETGARLARLRTARSAMKIVHLTASTFYGGPERQMLGLARALAGECRTVFLLFAEGGRRRAFADETRRQGYDAV